MKTYTILKNTVVYRGIEKAAERGGSRPFGGWSGITTDRKVIYTDCDLRVKGKITGSDFLEFDLPREAHPYNVLAVFNGAVEMSEITETSFVSGSLGEGVINVSFPNIEVKE